MFTPDKSGSGEGAAASAAVRRRWRSGCTLSFGLHAVVLAVLALCAMHTEPRPVQRALVALRAHDEVVIDIAPIEWPVEPIAPEPEARLEAIDDVNHADAGFGHDSPAAAVVEEPFVALVPDVDEGPLGVGLEDLGLALGEDEDGAGLGDEAVGAEVRFYGVKASGRRFVFVNDCSGSMNGYPLQRLKEQLHAVLGDLPERIEFFIVFFNHGPLPMPAKGCLAATRPHVRGALEWVDAIQADGGTDPSEALAIALALEPSVVFLLTDGMFPPEPALQAIARLNRERRAQINTIAIGQQGAEPVLRRIAAENRGEYRFVPF